MTRRSRGFGFVYFATPEACDAAVAALHGRELEGRRISVSRAVPQSQTAPGTPADALRRGQTIPREVGRVHRGGGGGSGGGRGAAGGQGSGSFERGGTYGGFDPAAAPFDPSLGYGGGAYYYAPGGEAVFTGVPYAAPPPYAYYAPVPPPFGRVPYYGAPAALAHAHAHAHAHAYGGVQPAAQPTAAPARQA